jgi:hypothetical protein
MTAGLSAGWQPTMRPSHSVVSQPNRRSVTTTTNVSRSAGVVGVPAPRLFHPSNDPRIVRITRIRRERDSSQWPSRLLSPLRTPPGTATTSRCWHGWRKVVSRLQATGRRARRCCLTRGRVAPPPGDGRRRGAVDSAAPTAERAQHPRRWRGWRDDPWTPRRGSAHRPAPRRPGLVQGRCRRVLDAGWQSRPLVAISPVSSPARPSRQRPGAGRPLISR